MEYITYVKLIEECMVTVEIQVIKLHLIYGMMAPLGVEMLKTRYIMIILIGVFDLEVEIGIHVKRLH